MRYVTYKKTTIQSISCAPDSGFTFALSFRVRYGVSIQRAMRLETRNLLLKDWWKKELKFRDLPNKSLEMRHYFPSQYKTCHSTMAAPKYNVRSSVNCLAYGT